MNEQKTINAILEGADKYHELVERYHVGLIIHSENIVKDRNEAEDIAQDAFIKAYTELNNYDPKKGRFSTWLYTIATNLAISYLRKQNRKVEVENIESIAEATMPQHIKKEQKQEVRRAVKNLMPPEYKKAIEAYYWHGKNYSEISDELDVPLNTVRTWIRRAKSQLKEDLA